MSIARLPSDVLVGIFVMCLPDTTIPYYRMYLGDFCTMAPLNLESVCRNWRMIVLSTRRLWTDICFRLERPPEVIFEMARRYVQKCLERGLLINCTHQTVIRLLPAVNIPDELIDEGCDTLADVLLRE